MKATALVVEDEYKVREVFINLLQTFCPEIEIVGEAENIYEAYQLIQNKKPAVVFLDIEMNGGNGFDLLNMFEEVDFEVIFVTSYDHYALKAIKYCALDYLLKPVTIEELQESVQDLLQRLQEKKSAERYKLLYENLKKSDKEAVLVLNTQTKLEYVKVSDILFLKGEGNYTTFYLQNGKHLVIAKTLKKYEEILCDESSGFFRIHKSYIVNTSYIKHLERGEETSIVLQDGTELEVSRRKKQELMNKLQ
jgi:two-component system LytT family response regulator